MAAKLQNPPPPTFPFSSPSAQAVAHQNPLQIVNGPSSSRSAAHLPQNSISTQHSNPFRTPRHTPHTSDASSPVVFSPVSPIEDNHDNRFRRQAPQPPQNTSRPDKMSSEPRKSVDLRKLDGKPYPGREDEADSKPRKVKVAQDMYAGDMPPGYEQQDYQGPLASKEGHSHTGSCNKCGGHKKSPSEGVSAVPAADERQAQNIDCNKCGGKKSTPPSSFPRAAMANARVPPQAAPRQSSEAGPSSAPSGHRHSQSTQQGLNTELQAQYQNDTYLSLPPDQRPGVTRFKSLRTGVNRAANGLSRSASQISRSTSLRRLESVKKVPQFWYRDDMAIEGAASEYNNYGY